MTDEEFIKILLGAVLPQYDADPFFKSIENLKAENAAMRDKLNKYENNITESENDIVKTANTKGIPHIEEK